MTTDTRVFYRDVRPYHTPSAWDAMQGPTQGWVSLPHSLYWATDSNSFDLNELDQLVVVYTAVVVEGTPADQERFLDPSTLTRVWPLLYLPERTRQLWEDRFPLLPR